MTRRVTPRTAGLLPRGAAYETYRCAQEFHTERWRGATDPDRARVHDWARRRAWRAAVAEWLDPPPGEADA